MCNVWLQKAAQGRQLEVLYAGVGSKRPAFLADHQGVQNAEAWRRRFLAEGDGYGFGVDVMLR